MQLAKAKGHLRGKPPKLSVPQRRLMEVHGAGTHTAAEIAELFNVARSTVEPHVPEVDEPRGDRAEDESQMRRARRPVPQDPPGENARRGTSNGSAEKQSQKDNGNPFPSVTSPL